jgi:hypothetical protein
MVVLLARPFQEVHMHVHGFQGSKSGHAYRVHCIKSNSQGFDISKASLNGSFKSVSCTLNTAPHKQNSTFCMKLLGERRKKFHHGETFRHCFTCI